MTNEPVQVQPTMTTEQLADYHTELRKELADLEFAQAMRPSEYKADRIKRLRQRLGIQNAPASG